MGWLVSSCAFPCWVDPSGIPLPQIPVGCFYVALTTSSTWKEGIQDEVVFQMWLPWFRSMGWMKVYWEEMGVPTVRDGFVVWGLASKKRSAKNNNNKTDSTALHHPYIVRAHEWSVVFFNTCSILFQLRLAPKSV